MNNEKTFRAQGQVFCSDVVFSYYKSSLAWQRKVTEDVEADLERSKEELVHISAIENQTLSYTSSPGCAAVIFAVKTSFFHPVMDMTFQLWRRDLTWDSLL